MLGPALRGGDEGQVDAGLHRRGELALGLFGGLLEPLEGHRVCAQVDAFLAFELVGDVMNQHFVQVVAAQVRVAVGGQHLEDVVADIHDGDVERAAAEVEHGHLLVLLLLQAVGQRRGGGLVDDALHLEPGDLAGILGGLPLGIVEVGRHGDDRALHLVAQVVLGGLLEVLENHGGDFLRRVILAAHADLYGFIRPADDLVGHHLLFRGHLVVPAAHEPLDREDGVLGVGHLLVLGRLADQDLALIGKADHAGRQPAALLVYKYLWRRAFHQSNYAVGRSQVNAYDLLACHIRDSRPLWAQKHSLGAGAIGVPTAAKSASTYFLNTYIYKPPAIQCHFRQFFPPTCKF